MDFRSYGKFWSSQFHRKWVHSWKLLVLIFQLPLPILPPLKHDIVYIVLPHVFFDLLFVKFSLHFLEFIQSSDSLLVCFSSFVFDGFHLLKHRDFISLHFAFHILDFSLNYFLDFTCDICWDVLAIIPVASLFNYIPVVFLPPFLVKFCLLLVFI